MSAHSTADAPLRVRVRFSGVSASGAKPEEQRASRCASGYVFEGLMELCDAEGCPLVSLPVQSGGWMCEDSPFTRAGLFPEDATWGAYEPRLYPDTAFPALEGETLLGTLRTGRHRGFRIPDPPGTGRSFLMVHSSTRFGSEGCISCPDGEEWERFCSFLAELFAQGVKSIPLRVAYDCPPPDPTRFPCTRAKG